MMYLFLKFLMVTLDPLNVALHDVSLHKIEPTTLNEDLLFILYHYSLLEGL
jgi:hypothetical protein